MKIEELGTFPFTTELRSSFAAGTLVASWRRTYPRLFDEDDERQAKRQTAHHFFEWLGAVLVYNSTGYLSLIEKYQFRNHSYKSATLAKIADKYLSAALALVGKPGRPQPPDLLVYSPDHKDWFFCEVKGGTDRLRPLHRQLFEQLGDVSQRPVRLLRFQKRRRGQ